MYVSSTTLRRQDRVQHTSQKKDNCRQSNVMRRSILSFNASGATFWRIASLSADMWLSESLNTSAVLQEQTLPSSSSDSWHSLQHSGILTLAIPMLSISGSEKEMQDIPWQLMEKNYGPKKSVDLTHIVEL